MHYLWMGEYGMSILGHTNQTTSYFFGSKKSKKEWKKVTAKDIWRKDRIHNRYLKSKGYTVVRFWEKEIRYEIDKCIQIIRSQIQAYKKK